MMPNSQACSDGYVPRGLLLQWHITNRCNLRCTHCYQETYGGEERPLPALLEILRQYEGLLAEWRQSPGRGSVRGHVTITGGEPFVHPDFMELLHELAMRREQFSFGILTNGLLICEEKAACLAELQPEFVQVSIEGTKETHDRIRGPGNYDQVIGCVRRLVHARIPTIISFTAHRHNFREFPKVAELGRELGVARVWTDRLIPSGSGKALEQAVMSPEETKDYCEIIEDARKRCAKDRSRTEISAHRALQFLTTGDTIYHCTAGDTLLTVMPNGDVYPCRRMPVAVGNAFRTSLRTIYAESHVLRELRSRSNLPSECGACYFRNQCRGGLRCLSFAVHGNAFQRDPGCWIPTAQKEGAGVAPKPNAAAQGSDCG